MTREDEVRQELLRMIEDDLENEPERNPHAWLRQTRQAGREYGHMHRSEVGDFVTGRMEADRAADLSDHVAGCERCRALVERERSDREEIARYDQQRARQLEQEAMCRRRAGAQTIQETPDAAQCKASQVSTYVKFRQWLRRITGF